MSHSTHHYCCVQFNPQCSTFLVMSHSTHHYCVQSNHSAHCTLEMSRLSHNIHHSWRCPICPLVLTIIVTVSSNPQCSLFLEMSVCPTELTDLVDVHEGLLDPLGQEALALGCAATIQQAQDAAALVTSWHTHTHTHTTRTHAHTPHTNTCTHTPHKHTNTRTTHTLHTCKKCLFH